MSQAFSPLRPAERAARLASQMQAAVAAAAQHVAKTQSHGTALNALLGMQKTLAAMQWQLVQISNDFSGETAVVPKAPKRKLRRRGEASPPAPLNEGPLPDDRHSLESDRGPATR